MVFSFKRYKGISPFQKWTDPFEKKCMIVEHVSNLFLLKPNSNEPIRSWWVNLIRE